MGISPIEQTGWNILNIRCIFELLWCFPFLLYFRPIRSSSQIINNLTINIFDLRYSFLIHAFFIGYHANNIINRTLSLWCTTIFIFICGRSILISYRSPVQIVFGLCPYQWFICTIEISSVFELCTCLLMGTLHRFYFYNYILFYLFG